MSDLMLSLSHYNRHIATTQSELRSFLGLASYYRR